MRVEAGVGEALALVLPEEAAVSQHDVVDLVTRTPAVQAVPLLLRLLALPKNFHLIKTSEKIKVSLKGK